jgi:hypothetical protein
MRNTQYARQGNAAFARALRDNRPSRKVQAKRNNQTTIGAVLIALCALGIIGAIGGAIYADTICKPSTSIICKR